MGSNPTITKANFALIDLLITTACKSEHGVCLHVLVLNNMLTKCPLTFVPLQFTDLLFIKHSLLRQKCKY